MLAFSSSLRECEIFSFFQWNIIFALSKGGAFVRIFYARRWVFWTIQLGPASDICILQFLKENW